MEDYKEKYEGALERCQEFYNKISNKTLREEAEKIFPELKELEDERIRKDIIKLVEESTALRNYYNLREMTAWLEKQGEKKLPEIHIPKFKIGDTIRLKNSFAEYTITDISDGCYHGDGWGLGVIAADESGDYELVEKKPADAEVTVTDTLIGAESDADYINDLTEYFDGCALCHSEEEIIKWLDSLKNKLSCKEKD